ASVLEDVSPIRMLAALRVHERAQHVDLDAFLARVFDHPGGQQAANTFAAEHVGHLGVVGDYQFVAGTAVGEFGLGIDALDPADITALVGTSFTRDLDFVHGPPRGLPLRINWVLEWRRQGFKPAPPAGPSLWLPRHASARRRARQALPRSTR